MGIGKLACVTPALKTVNRRTKPMFFRSDNCDFDVASRCYLVRLPQLVPQLGSEIIFRDVYIPERFVFGVAVKHGNGPPEDMRRFGFV